MVMLGPDSFADQALSWSCVLAAGDLHLDPTLEIFGCRCVAQFQCLLQGVSRLSLAIEWFGRGGGGKLLIKHSPMNWMRMSGMLLSLLVNKDDCQRPLSLCASCRGEAV